MDARFDSLDPARGGRSFRFQGQRDEVVARCVEEVIPALQQVEEAVGAGWHAAGYIAYEAAPACDPALQVQGSGADHDLLRFGIYEERIEGSGLEGLDGGEGSGRYSLGPLVASLEEAEYGARVRRILEWIAAGDTYQVNFSVRLRGTFAGSHLALYRDLCLAQRSAFCARLAFGDRVLISASPELFFHTRGGAIEMRPMKGTRSRGRWSEEDLEIARELLASPKDRAENLMIVDLLRNDLGRIAEFGTVHVPALFQLEAYPTVFQLTSRIGAELRTGVDLVGLFRALFPSGSVTGAPKIRTAEIIRDLEDSPRGPYTGAIGFVSPDERAFSVAIRTAVLDLRTGRLDLGVGSGITADSDPAAEYAECLEKGAFLWHRVPEFQLLESLRLEVPGGYPLLSHHLARIASSAAYFAFRWDESGARQALDAIASGVVPGLYKVRLRVARNGEVATEIEPIPPRLPSARLRLSPVSVHSTDAFLYHKTTFRDIYERALAAAGAGCDDVVLINERGEVTEATRANLVVELDGDWVTPPVESGLLPGVKRSILLDEGRVRSRVLRLEDLRRADGIHLLNSVRGWREARLVEPCRRDRSTGEPA